MVTRSKKKVAKKRAAAPKMRKKITARGKEATPTAPAPAKREQAGNGAEPIERVIYSVREVSKMLGLALSTVYEMMRANQLPCLQIGTTYKIPKKAFDEWMDERTSKGTAHMPVKQTRGRPAQKKKATDKMTRKEYLKSLNAKAS